MFRLSRLMVTAVLVMLCAVEPARGQEATQGQALAPVVRTNKLTMAYYGFSSGTVGADVNLRHTFPSQTAWVGMYHESDGFDQARAGWEYDYHREWLTLVPSVQAASHGFLGASVYGEAGRRVYAIGGAGRTNLNPYWNLGFDPNDYVEAGVGMRDDAGDVLSVFAIHDNRLETGQTNTHLYARRYFTHEWRLTLDIVREHGRGDTGAMVRAWSTSIDAEWRRWFVRLAEDPHVNYTADRQFRVAGGVRF